MSALLRIQDLRVHFEVPQPFLSKEKKWIKAVDGVSLTIQEKQSYGLVGESGCGKSTLIRAMLRLIPATSGEVFLGEENFLALEGEKLRQKRAFAQLVFQDPYASLDPRMTVYDLLAEPCYAHRRPKEAEVEKRILKCLDQVGLSPQVVSKYPHEFSGGQRQRIAIARALILQPKLLVADEPVSSLDVSVQAQILNLLKDLKNELGLSLLFVSHNLAVVRYLCDSISVMYLGKIVEEAPAEAIFQKPVHPYTEALLASVPIPDPKKERSRPRPLAKGEPPSPRKPPPGCAFHPRCTLSEERCSNTVPPLDPLITDPGNHCVACLVRNSPVS